MSGIASVVLRARGGPFKFELLCKRPVGGDHVCMFGRRTTKIFDMGAQKCVCAFFISACAHKFHFSRKYTRAELYIGNEVVAVAAVLIYICWLCVLCDKLHVSIFTHTHACACVSSSAERCDVPLKNAHGWSSQTYSILICAQCHLLEAGGGTDIRLCA